METPTILYLNNRYFCSLEELKAYFGSKLNETQKGELIAAFRDRVLYDWLNEGGETEKQIGGDMLPILGQHLGNGEILAKIAALFDVPNPLIADYKFVDHAEYVGCVAIGSSDEQTQHQTVPNDGVIHIKKGITKINIVFKFKILAPENDHLSLRLAISPKIENAVSVEQTKLDLIGKKNEIKTIELDIDVEKLCKESGLTLYHDNTEVCRVTIDNHENTNKDVEYITEIDSTGFKKIEIVARGIYSKTRKNKDGLGRIRAELQIDDQDNENKDNNIFTTPSYYFFSKQGRQRVLDGMKLLKNDMYPDFADFEFGFYYKELNNSRFLFYIDNEGYRGLGKFFDAIPLNDNLVAIRRDKNTNFYSVIDRFGKTQLENNRFGKILGVTKDNIFVCEIGLEQYVLADANGKTVIDANSYNRFVVNPKSSIVCAINEENNGCELCYLNYEDEKYKEEKSYSIGVRWGKKVFVYRDSIIVFYPSLSKKTISGTIIGLGSSYVSVRDFANVKVWNGSYLLTTYNKVLFSVYHRFDWNYYSGFISFATDRWIYDEYDKYFYFKGNKEYYDRIKIFALDSSGAASLNFVSLDAAKKKIFLDKIKKHEIESKVLVEYNSHFSVDLQQVCSYGDFVCIRYSLSSTSRRNTVSSECTLIVDRNGDEVYHDKIRNYNNLCGPINNMYYYLKDGELFCVDGDKSGEVGLSNYLQGKELIPLGTTTHFVVKYDKGFQIINNQGKKLGEPFEMFDVPQSNSTKYFMDYIYNSQYLPIKNEKGKCGLIDTNAEIIVPCEFNEVEDLNSIFKREGIVFF